MATNNITLTSDAEVALPQSVSLTSDAEIAPPPSTTLTSDAEVVGPMSLTLPSDAQVTGPSALALRSDAWITSEHSIFDDRPLLNFYPDFINLKHGQLDDFGLRSAGAGVATPWKPTTKLKRKQTVPFTFHNRGDWRDFRDFFGDRKGLLDGFWMPIWLTDYPSSVQTTGATFVDIDAIGLGAVFAAGNQFAFCALINKTVIEPHRITSVTAKPGNRERLTLDSAIVGTFPIAESVFCGLMLVRLATEKLDWKWITDGVVGIDLETIELPAEYAEANEIEQPIYLYQFTRGNKVYRMADWGQDVTAGNELWIAENIQHGELEDTLDFLNQGFQLDVATDRADHPMRYYLQDRDGTEMTTLIVYKVDAATLTLDTAHPFYTGRVESVAAGDQGKITVKCSSNLRIAELQVPRPEIQRLCNHRNGDANCGIDVAAFTTAGTLVNVTADHVSANEFATKAAAQADPNWFALGKITVGTEVRLCVGQDSEKLYIDVPFRHAAIGQAVSATAGDDKRVGTCLAKFNNLARFAGFPYLPNQDPQLTGLLTPKVSGGKKS